MDDKFLLSYNASDLRIASEFLSTWLPFLSRDLCHRCTQTLSCRIRSLEPGVPVDVEGVKQEQSREVLTSNGENQSECNGHQENWDTNSLGSWKDAGERNDTAEETASLGSWKDAGEVNDTADTSSIGSWKDGASGWSEADVERSASRPVSVSNESPRARMSWADMAQEDELGEEDDEEQRESIRQLDNGYGAVEVQAKQVLSRDQREYFRFTKVSRKKDFICLERVNGKIINILEGLELHSGVFSAAEQKRIVDFVYELQESGKKGELKERTYTAPQKWMRGKGRVTIQFGCCYNYATDKNNNPPGILPHASVDPIPHLFKVIIRRLVRWHVLPTSCVPDSCIVNIYDEGDCIPPHIDNHDFLRPFCTVSFLSECDILFGTNLKIVGAGEFSGSTAIPLPVGSVLVLNGNGADVAKHCVPAVPSKRISITFRKMDESKRPIGFVPEPDLQRLQPLSYETETPTRHTPRPKPYQNRQPDRREGRGYRSQESAEGAEDIDHRNQNRQPDRRGGRGYRSQGWAEEAEDVDHRDQHRQQDRRGGRGYRSQGSAGRGTPNSDSRNSLQVQLGPSNRRTVRRNSAY